MKILLTNDDGYASSGITALFNTLARHHDVIMVAPDTEKSAVGHGISLNTPLRLEKLDLGDRKKGYAVNGTPTDCVKLGLFELFRSPPDVVISGINPGSNTGVNLNYSGTVAAAREACLNGIPGIAVSLEVTEKKHLDFYGIAGFINDLLADFSRIYLPAGTFLNINCPDCPVKETKGAKITRVATDNISEKFEKRLDPKERPYFWYANPGLSGTKEDTDIHCLSQNYISISPVKCDITDYSALKRLETN